MLVVICRVGLSGWVRVGPGGSGWNQAKCFCGEREGRGASGFGRTGRQRITALELLR